MLYADLLLPRLSNLGGINEGKMKVKKKMKGVAPLYYELRVLCSVTGCTMHNSRCSMIHAQCFMRHKADAQYQQAGFFSNLIFGTRKHIPQYWRGISRYTGLGKIFCFLRAKFLKLYLPARNAYDFCENFPLY